ncbi:MAG: BREX protein BrxB domain-containing protein [Halanaerobiales bacterium]
MTNQNSTISPLDSFKNKLKDFALGRNKGIRNPFVIVPVKPNLERLLGEKLTSWSNNKKSSRDKYSIDIFNLDELMPMTTVFNIAMQVKNDDNDIENTLKNNLGNEIVELIVNQNEERLYKSNNIILLLNLGSLYPFTRASEILDELDRLKVKSTIGIPFPGEIIAGKLSFFGEDTRHYYPAHRIEDQIEEVHLQ